MMKLKIKVVLYDGEKEWRLKVLIVEVSLRYFVGVVVLGLKVGVVGWGLVVEDMESKGVEFGSGI